MSLFGKKPHDETVTRIFESYKHPHRYRPVRAIGEGGLAQVSSCFDSYLNRVVALKELKSANLANSFLVQSFVNEARLMSYLDHPGVVSVFDAFVLDNERLCYTMTQVEGESLAAVLDTDNLFNKRPRLSVAQSLDTFTKLAETLAYVHDRGVLHLDLKPENIMVGKYGQVLVMDWGSARLFDVKPYEEHIRKHTDRGDWATLEKERTNLVMGTPLYMSPEQTNTPRDMLTPGSDVFSAGVVLYEMLAGRRPFQADTSEEVMALVRGHHPVPVRDINADVPRRLSAIVDKMLQKQAFERYRTFHEVLDDVQELRNAGVAFPVRTFAAGETIVTEGEEGDFAFAILAGTVEVSKTVEGSRKVLATMGRGEIIGELAVFTTHPRTATVTAKEPTTIRVLKEADVRKELEKMSPWVGAMIRGLSERFIDINERLARSK